MATEQPLPLGQTQAQRRGSATLPSSAVTPRDDFDAFYVKEVRAVTVFLLHQGASPYEAADAAHEAISKLLPHKWRTVEYPRAWLRVTAWRCYLRQHDRRDSPTDSVPDRPGGTCPLNEVILTDAQQRVLTALQALPIQRRTVMAWHIDGFPYEEIAKALELSNAAVRKHVSRARQTLIDTLNLAKGDADD